MKKINGRLFRVKKKYNAAKVRHEELKKTVTLEYITGTSAFNIPYKNEVYDWHQDGMLNSGKFIINKKDLIGAESIFGSYGLRDCSSFLLKHHVSPSIPKLCASPIRAILDLLFNSLVKDKYPQVIEDIENQFMIDEIDRVELSKRLDELETNFSVHNRLENLKKWRLNNGF